MRIGKIEFRLPWTRYVEVELEREIYWAIRQSILEDLLAESKEKAQDKTTEVK